MRKPITYLTLALTMVLASCGGDGDGDGEENPGTAARPSNIPADCPVTIPDGSYTPPAEYPANPQGRDVAWFGSDELWTALPTDGDYARRKSLWWSVNFEGGATERKPEIGVVWNRLDEEQEPISSGPPGTQASTPADGDYMIGGTDPIEPGCWEVTATYKGASLTYVYYLRG